MTADRVDSLTAAIQEWAQALYAAAQDAAGDRRTTLFADSSLLFEAVAALAELSALAEQQQGNGSETTAPQSSVAEAVQAANIGSGVRLDPDDPDEYVFLTDPPAHIFCRTDSDKSPAERSARARLVVTAVNAALASVVSGAGSTAGGVRLDADAVAEADIAAWQRGPSCDPDVRKRLEEWSRDSLHLVQSVREHRPTYANPSELRRDVRALLTSVVSGAGTQPTPEPEEKP